MSALLLAHSFAPIAMALAVPVPVAALDLPDERFELPPSPPKEQARQRDETMPRLDAAQFPTGFEPPTKTWSMAGGPVLELGALGSRRFKAPDVVHLALGWDF